MTSAHMTAYKSGEHHSAESGDEHVVYTFATFAVLKFFFYFLQHFNLTLLLGLYKCHSLSFLSKYLN